MNEEQIMTEEQYKRKYEDALKRAKAILKVADNDESFDYVSTIFPELVENKDEEIRKALIERITEIDLEESIKGSGFYAGDYDANDCIAWLEKQDKVDTSSYEVAEKEKYDFVSGKFIECRKSFDEFKEDNSYWLEYVGNDTYIGRSDNVLNQKFHITPKQLYSSFAEKKELKKTNSYCQENCKGYQETGKCFFDGGCDAKRKAEQESVAWSKDDEAMFQSCTGAIWAADSCLYEEKQEIEAWIESLKNRVHPQSNQELDEEDSKRIDYICDFIWKNRKGDTDEIYQQEQDVKWLKSLKDRVHPQTKEWSEEDDAYKLFAISAVEDYYDEENPLQKAIVDWLKSLKDRLIWKPSKEQMDALLGVMVESGFNYIDYNTLESLYNDLKKL